MTPTFYKITSRIASANLHFRRVCGASEKYEKNAAGSSSTDGVLPHCKRQHLRFLQILARFVSFPHRRRIANSSRSQCARADNIPRISATDLVELLETTDIHGKIRQNIGHQLFVRHSPQGDEVKILVPQIFMLATKPPHFSHKTAPPTGA